MRERDEKCVAYWIRSPDHSDITKEGYVGITCRLKTRIWEHKKSAKVLTVYKHKDFREALNTGKYEASVVFEGDREECLDFEYKMRPSTYIGWNVREGGRNGRYPSKLITRESTGETKMAMDWCYERGLHPKTLYNRLERGWSIEEALGFCDRIMELEDEYLLTRYDVLHKLETTLFYPNYIKKNSNIPNTNLKLFLKDFIPDDSPLYTHAYYPLEETNAYLKVRRLPESVGHWDKFFEIERRMLEAGNPNQVSKELGVSSYLCRKVVEEVEQGEYLSELDYEVDDETPRIVSNRGFTLGVYPRLDGYPDLQGVTNEETILCK